MKAIVVIGYFDNGTFREDRKLRLEVWSGKDEGHCVFVPGIQGVVKVWWKDDGGAAWWYGEVDVATRRGR
jgi:hypothetical protein